MSNSNDLDMNSLSEEEAQQLRSDIATAQQNILRVRQEKQQETLRAQYQAELQQLVNQWGRGNTERRIEAIADLKARYRARGLQVF